MGAEKPTKPDDIEVTPGMIEAGMHVIFDLGGIDTGHISSGRLAIQVFRAMRFAEATQAPASSDWSDELAL